MKRPNIFIVGAPKCGTTAMHHYLSLHPEIFMAPMPEPHYFGSDLNYWWFPRYTEEQYLQLFSAAGNRKVIGEKSTSYLVSTRAAAEIKDFSPNAKLIAMLRNPADMLYSLHSQAIEGGREIIRDFEKALSTEEDRKLGPPDQWENVQFVNAQFYRRLPDYATQLRRYYDRFGRENVHVVIFDDLKADTSTVYRETLKFLNVDERVTPNFDIVNPNVHVRSLQLLHPPELARKLLRAVIPRRLRQMLRTKVNKVNVVQKPRRPMSTLLRKRLNESYASEIEQLSRMIDRDLTFWTQ